MFALQRGAFPLANCIALDTSNPPKVFNQMLAQGLFPDVGHPTAAAPPDMQSCPCHAATPLMGAKHSCFCQVHAMRQACERSCLHVPISRCRTLALWLCDGSTSSHTQRSRLSHVTRPGITKEPPHGERSWRKVRGWPSGDYTSPTDAQADSARPRRWLCHWAGYLFSSV